MSESQSPLVAVDVGNTRVKLGLFESATAAGLPAPSKTLSLASLDGELAQVETWLGPLAANTVNWRIASVNRPTSTRLVEWLRDRAGAERVRLLASTDLPLEVRLARPDMVGIDRLAGAAAANVLRPAGKPAVIVDLGTAIKVDLVGADGAFLGGAILPGIGLSARALHEFTDLLPLINMEDLKEAPAAIGTSTVDAMRSGLFWGAIGAARELIDRFSQVLGGQPQVFLCGGAAASVTKLLAPDARYEPNLVLAGIALAHALP